MNISVLAKVHGVARLRKSAREVEAAERMLKEHPERIHVIASIAEFLFESEESPPSIISLARAFLETLRFGDSGSGEPPFLELLRAANDFKHGLMREAGQAPADWDLCDRSDLLPQAPPDRKPVRLRDFIPGLRVYLEDLRSPFNVGTTFRTAEAFGFEELILSPACADPGHPRAKRSSMGAVDLLPWKRASLDEVSEEVTLFALELGGVPVEEFQFPEHGLMIIGSEELGVSSSSLKRCEGRRVSIPLYGVKASLNVAVAFGIAARSWVFSRHRAKGNYRA